MLATIGTKTAFASFRSDFVGLVYIYILYDFRTSFTWSSWFQLTNIGFQIDKMEQDTVHQTPNTGKSIVDHSIFPSESEQETQATFKISDCTWKWNASIKAAKPAFCHTHTHKRNTNNNNNNRNSSAKWMWTGKKTSFFVLFWIRIVKLKLYTWKKRKRKTIFTALPMILRMYKFEIMWIYWRMLA